MLNFIPRNLHTVPLLVMRAWAFGSVAAPLAMTGLCLLFLAGLAAAYGAPVGVTLDGFLTDVAEPLARVSAQLWVTGFFMMVVCYGVSRQLIRRTLNGPLCAPLARLMGLFGRQMRCMARFLYVAAGPATSPQHLFLGFRDNTPERPPPVALLAGTAPLRE